MILKPGLFTRSPQMGPKMDIRHEEVHCGHGRTANSYTASESATGAVMVRQEKIPKAGPRGDGSLSTDSQSSSSSWFCEQPRAKATSPLLSDTCDQMETGLTAISVLLEFFLWPISTTSREAKPGGSSIKTSSTATVVNQIPSRLARRLMCDARGRNPSIFPFMHPILWQHLFKVNFDTYLGVLCAGTKNVIAVPAKSCK